MGVSFVVPKMTYPIELQQGWAVTELWEPDPSQGRWVAHSDTAGTDDVVRCLLKPWLSTRIVLSCTLNIRVLETNYRHRLKAKGSMHKLYQARRSASDSATFNAGDGHPLWVEQLDPLFQKHVSFVFSCCWSNNRRQKLAFMATPMHSLLVFLKKNSFFDFHLLVTVVTSVLHYKKLPRAVCSRYIIDKATRIWQNNKLC